MEFKERLRALREKNSLSATQLAGTFDKSEGAVRMWETGRSLPDASTLIKLAQYFNCTTDYLLGLSDIKNQEQMEKARNLESNLYTSLQELPIETREKIYNAFTRLTNAICDISGDYIALTACELAVKDILNGLAAIAETYHMRNILDVSDALLKLANINNLISRSSDKVVQLFEELLDPHFQKRIRELSPTEGEPDA